MSTPAFLLLDLLHGILGRYGDVSAYLARIAAAADAARAAGIPVVHVTVAFRDGHPEVSRRNKGFAAIADAGGLLASEASGQIVDEVAPHAGEVVVTKKRISAFAGSDLDLVLRALHVDHLVLAGVSTSGVVLSTVRQAADLDFELTVLADGCLDQDPAVHAMLTETLFPRQAAVVTVEAWIGSL